VACFTGQKERVHVIIRSEFFRFVVAEIPVTAQAQRGSLAICGYGFIGYVEMTGAHPTAQFLGEFFSNNLLSGNYRLGGLEIKKLAEGKQAHHDNYQKEVA
jgi:hypothetical protein